MLILSILLALGGCASQRELVSAAPSMQDRSAPVELADTPFFPDDALQCGPAALATVLGASQNGQHYNDLRGSDPATLAREVYTPGLGGSLQLELVAAARQRGFVPYALPPEADALFAELVAGRPVLVLQNLRLRTLPAWHYAVVIGADPVNETVILRSGTEKRLVMPAGKFMRTWDLAERWGLVLLRPGELPATLERERYFAAVAGVEAAGRHADAARAWRAALGPWPDDPVALFGHATASHLAGDLATAYDAYLALLLLEPGHAAALNNLANLLAGQGCRVAAHIMAQQALESATPDSAIAAAARETLQRLEADTVRGGTCELP
nr:PA2778 family cysteine peptidase [Thioalkalivibrio sp. XN279]